VAAEVSSAVRQFIGGFIDSLEQLEILLLLFSSSEKEWTARSVYEDIKSSPASVQSRLDTLHTQGLIARVPPDRFRYSPATQELAEAVEGLAKSYKDNRIQIIELIFSKPSSPILGFADAFRIRRDKKDG
jgi:hypothetical protein